MFSFCEQQHFNRCSFRCSYRLKWICLGVLEVQVSISCAFHVVVHCVFYQMLSMSENIFCCNLFNEEGHSHVGNNFRPIQPWLVHFVSTVKQGTKFCVNCRITVYKRVKPAIYITIQEQMSMNYKKLGKKKMIHPMTQMMLVLQILLLKYYTAYIIRNSLPADYSVCHLLSRWYLARLIRPWKRKQ
jgi:hypothetical protein